MVPLPPTPFSRLVRFAAGRFAADIAGVVVVLAVTAVNAWNLLRDGTMIGLDTAAHFFPVYSVLGERLRAGDIPGWNPHQFAGVPFAADPESGWAYFPAMLLFSALPLAAAAAASIVLHFLLAGLAAYALARVLGINVAGAVVAAAAYESTGFLVDRSVCCLVHVQVAAWLPLLLLGAELALRSRTRLARACWWGVSGFALSQIAAAWLGQGTAYALLALGGYVAYRTVLVPAIPGRFRVRLAALVGHLGAILLFGGALAAAGVLPRLEYNPRTNLAGGHYRGDLAWAAVIGGWVDKGEFAARLLGRTGWYVGGATAALAIVALSLARTRYAAPYFALLTLGALVLAGQRTTPLHWTLYKVLPRFEELHRHYPDRILVVFYLGPPILAGAAVSSLWRMRRRSAFAGLAAALPVLLALLARNGGVAIPNSTLWAAVAACLLAAACVLVPRRSVQRLAAALLLPVVVVDLFAAGHDIVHNGPTTRGRLFYQVDLDDYFDPAGAAAFLRSRPETEPFRFFGYDPALMPPNLGFYRYGFIDPTATALLLNNRGAVFGLQDLQGYNPIQLRRYVEYMKALNGHAQEYHEANVHPAGLDSPLLDLLNARYIVVPATSPGDRPDLLRLTREHPTVYADDLVRVLENREALPRAWIVHAAQRVPPDEALRLLAAGTIDPRATALLEDPAPELAPPVDATAERAIFTAYESDRLRLRTSAATPGLLMLGEVAYPAWRAYVDGERVPLLTANYLFRAVPIPAGEHRVELRFESTALRLGTAGSLVAHLGLVGLLVAAVWRQRLRPRCMLSRDTPVVADRPSLSLATGENLRD